MSIGEGIYCNSEIAAWFRVLDGENTKPRFVVSDAINEKIETIAELIKKEQWIRPEIEIK